MISIISLLKVKQLLLSDFSLFQKSIKHKVYFSKTNDSIHIFSSIKVFLINSFWTREKCLIHLNVEDITDRKIYRRSF